MADSKDASSQAKKDSPGRWSTQTVLTVLALLGAAFGAGVKFGNDRGAERIEVLKEERSACETAKSELDGKYNQVVQAQVVLQNDLKACKNLTPPATDSGGNVQMDTQVLVGETMVVLKNQLFLGVTATTPDPVPPHFKASMTLGAKGKENLLWEGRSGDVKNFEGFEVRILAIDAASAHFHIQRAH